MTISDLVLSPINHSYQHSFRRGGLLPLQPPLLWKIESGFVRTLTWDEEGMIATLGVWGPGDIVGKPLSQIELYQIECLTTVKVSCLPFDRDDLQDPLLLHMKSMEEFLSIIHCQRVSLRLLKFLTWLACKFGQKVKQGWLIDLCLTHQQIAEITGTTRVTTTRLLNQFRQEGKLTRLRQHRILLLNL